MQKWQAESAVRRTRRASPIPCARPIYSLGPKPLFLASTQIPLVFSSQIPHLIRHPAQPATTRTATPISVLNALATPSLPDPFVTAYLAVCLRGDGNGEEEEEEPKGEPGLAVRNNAGRGYGHECCTQGCRPGARRCTGGGHRSSVR